MQKNLIEDRKMFKDGLPGHLPRADGYGMY